MGYKLPYLLNFKGRKSEKVARALILIVLWNDSMENKARSYKISLKPLELCRISSIKNR
ncbi:MAG: DUF4322 domain-containing protein [Caldisphaera sp.]